MKRTIQKAIPLFAGLSLFALSAISQETSSGTAEVIRIPMQPQYWEYDTAGAEFIMNRGVEAVRIKTGAPLFARGQQFSNGTIEYDIELGEGFPGICFRLSADRKNGENFYLRYFGSTSPEGRTTLQYAAMLDSMSLWDLTDEYQAGAKLNIPGWNHVKLVVSGKQMKAYVNDMDRPALIVPELEAGTTKGGIFFFGGRVTMANLVIRPGAVENLDPAPGYTSVYNDTRYLRSWLVSPATDFAYGKDVVPVLPYMGATTARADLPDSTLKWRPVKAEARGIVNLTRIYGRVVNNGRRLAWLKTTIYSDRPQERMLHLGFSDEIWMFVNGQTMYIDKNHFGSPAQKFPKGRCTIENAVIKLPLKQGKNEILIALANYFYGWGMIARLDDTEGIHLSADGQ